MTDAVPTPEELEAIYGGPLPSRFDTWLAVREELLAKLDEQRAKLGPKPAVRWLDLNDGKVYDQPEGGQPIDPTEEPR